jgi:hypothetical protein
MPRRVRRGIVVLRVRRYSTSVAGSSGSVAVSAMRSRRWSAIAPAPSWPWSCSTCSTSPESFSEFVASVAPSMTGSVWTPLSRSAALMARTLRRGRHGWLCPVRLHGTSAEAEQARTDRRPQCRAWT